MLSAVHAAMLNPTNYKCVIWICFSSNYCHLYIILLAMQLNTKQTCFLYFINRELRSIKSVSDNNYLIKYSGISI